VADARPTILQIIPRLDTGGAELSTIEIAGAIVSAGGIALVATEGGRMADRLAATGAEIIPFPAGAKNPARLLANAQALRRIIRERGVDIIHARSRAPAWSALLAARRTGIPFVTTYHGAYAERGRLKRLYNSVMARADIVIANSHYTADLVRTRYGTPEARIRVIHRGVDMAQFDPQRIAPERMRCLREAWGVGPDRPIVLQAARLTSWKGQGILVEAAGLLLERDRLDNAVIVLAGDDQGRDAYADGLRTQIERRGLIGRVLLVGHVDDMAAAFATAHVTVVASTEPEAFGRAAAEAEAMACPVIATDIGAPRETVLAAESVGLAKATGWLVPPGDAAALAERLDVALHLSSGARSEVGRRARLHVNENFTLEAMRSATLAVYRELLQTCTGERFAGFTSLARTDGPGGRPV
jgi:glycosyltransferase involved in cell wall biosynthesis